MSRQVRLFCRLLRFCPASFRAEYADEMTRLFAEQLDDAAESGRRLAVLRLWTDSLIDLAMTAPGHHIQKEEPVPRPVDVGSASAFVPENRQWVGPRVALGLLLLWLWVFFLVLAPGFMDPVFSNPPAVLGLPAGVMLVLAALGWMALGVILLRRTSTTVGALIAFLAFTVPATLMILLTPAAVLIIFNLAV